MKSADNSLEHYSAFPPHGLPAEDSGLDWPGLLQTCCTSVSTSVHHFIVCLFV